MLACGRGHTGAWEGPCRCVGGAMLVCGRGHAGVGGAMFSIATVCKVCWYSEEHVSGSELRGFWASETWNDVHCIFLAVVLYWTYVHVLYVYASYILETVSC